MSGSSQNPGYCLLSIVWLVPVSRVCKLPGQTGPSPSRALAGFYLTARPTQKTTAPRCHWPNRNPRPVLGHQITKPIPRSLATKTQPAPTRRAASRPLVDRELSERPGPTRPHVRYGWPHDSTLR